MTYIRVKWHHNLSKEPILLFSERDAQRFETRKVEVFRDGRQAYASESEDYGASFLGEKPTPDLNVLNIDSKFEAVSMSGPEFEKICAAKNGKYIE